MVREKTVGVITFKRDGHSIRYLLLHHGGSYWNFPKGRQEGLETELESALRELREETGITNIKIIDGFCDGYDYDFDTVIEDGVKEKVCKQAVFYLGEVLENEVKISDEHIDYGWFDFKTAQDRMFYQEGRSLLKRAHAFLSKQHDFVL
ncbi:MAG: NUDIX domain-containing protein [Patescibacteria group bacterium]|jgi:8-oxo-dGTP pyrophosphatase MutT (NUDIX family)|nr:NUDIX domain-containing protein [Patescibacteria group bacterium]